MDLNHRTRRGQIYSLLRLTASLSHQITGAGRGNRTLLISLEGWSITTMLCPQLVKILKILSINKLSRSERVFFY